MSPIRIDPCWFGSAKPSAFENCNTVCNGDGPAVGPSVTCDDDCARARPPLAYHTDCAYSEGDCSYQVQCVGEPVVTGKCP